MEKRKPKLFSVMKGYTKEQFVKDVISGIIVAIIALPLSIALALASGVTPEKGIYTAIAGGFLIAFLGGSRVQIAGPTAAFATIVAGIVAKDGFDSLIIATLLAGLILILMGLFRMGSLIKFIPYPITTGFTAGIAATIFIGQIKDFLGLTIVSKEPLIETVDKIKYDLLFLHTINWQAVCVGIVSLAILIVWPKINQKIPGSLIAVIAGIVLVKFAGLKANTIGDLYQISNKMPPLTVPHMNFHMINAQLGNAFTIAILAAIESLLSCVVADSMIHSRHRSNMELIAQGAGNIASALFGGIPATGAIARTAANIKNGGRTPIAGMVHSVALLLILVILMPYAALIPMPAIAAILFEVAYNMSGWRKFVQLLKSSPKSDIIILVTTFLLTIFFDLVIAIEFGMILAALLFMKRMSEVTEVEGWKYAEDDDDDPDSISLRKVPDNTLVYEISGPMFFGAADKILEISLNPKDNCLILRMRSVGAIDATAMRSLEMLFAECKKKKITLVLSHVNEQPMRIMEKAGFIDKLGKDHFCAHIDDALSFAEKLQVQA
ncbi:SulP family inorganic anion transporter [[Clostridium] polysaccharolyticum]|uniref:Sulfate permease, SulP family n=1 Tax=[Clostridium] polysaccharolyticum TaxID=29364 RepID=A0A1H9YYS0_9FIRM|nr:SulP family inorganic anion transporter [[Clostridium] polysaccharolyticum]SES73734.1 sulfate permease, SulP family [[Clostridium] polysaccharolyticum]